MGKYKPYAEWTEEQKARHRERKRRHYAENREQERERNKRWHRNNPEKSAAWNARKIPATIERNRQQRAGPVRGPVLRARDAVNNAVKAGRLIRPEACSQCGVVCTPHGHHPDYDKPLEVVWLCPPCHTKEHYPDVD